MASVPLTPVSVVPATATWTQLGTTPAAGKVQACDIRATNIHVSADANAKLRINNGATIVNRGGIIPIPFGTTDSAQDLERKFILPAGWYFEAWASAGSNIEFSLSGFQDDV